MSEWKEYKLSEIGQVVGGATPSTKEPLFYDGDISWITPKDLSVLQSRYISRGERNITKLGFDSCSSKMLPKHSILFSSRAPIGYVAISQNEVCTNQGFKSIVPNKETIDYMFLYYLLVNNKENIANLGSGTIFMEVSGSVMKQFSVLIPTSLNEQKKIAAILSSLDDKIETNRAINARLEELAAAIFKSWFIDFEPFADGEFIEDEYGRRPKGWKIVNLDEIAEIVGGATPSKDIAEYFTLPGSGIAWLTPKDLSITRAKFSSHGETDITELGYTKCSTKIMPAGSVLFSSRAPIGYISIALNTICTNQGFKSAVPKKVSTEFLYYTLFFKKEEIENKSTGSTFKEASGALMKSLKVILPFKEVLSKFDVIIKPIFERQKNIETENTRLASLRDTLLPRLMSGELISE